MKKCHVGIAGCGPAGLAAALFLHGQGHRVTLVDQLEAPMPVGSGFMLQATGLAVLRALGLEQGIRTLGVEIERIHGRALPSHRTVLDVRYDKLGENLRGLAVHRAALFDLLYEEVCRADIEVVTNACLVGAACHAGTQTSFLMLDGREVGPFDCAVDGLGARSPLNESEGRSRRRDLAFGALWTNLEVADAAAPLARSRNSLEQVYRRASQMAGVMPIGQVSPGGPAHAAFFWSMKSADEPAWRARMAGGGLGAWKEEIAAGWPEAHDLLQGIADPSQLVFARYGHHTLSRFHRDGIVSIGDAAHSTSPQLGQGVNMALLDAHALSAAFLTGRDIEDAFYRYAKARCLHVRAYQALSRVFTPVYQSDSRVLPFLRDWLFAPAARLPLVPELLARVVSGTLLDPAIEIDEGAAGDRRP